MANPVIAGSALGAEAGILRGEFFGTYKPQYKGLENRIKNIMQMGIPSDRDTEVFHYWETTPYFQRWPRGQSIAKKSFRGVRFNASPVDWGMGIEMHANDRADDRTKRMLDQARQIARSAAHLDERVVVGQILEGVTDLTLLESVPNAADGAALYATTAAGTDRFGVTGGNIVTGSGVTDTVLIRTDYYTVLSRFMQFQDTEGQPLLDASIFAPGVTVIYNPANEQVMKEAFFQTLTAFANSASNAAVSNLLRDMSVELIPNQRITGNNWYAFLNGAEVKAIASLDRQPIVDKLFTTENDRIAAETKMESLQFDTRRGYVIGVPYVTIQVTNS